MKVEQVEAINAAIQALGLGIRSTSDRGAQSQMANAINKLQEAFAGMTY